MGKKQKPSPHRSCKDVRSYLSQKSGVDSDLPADLSAYRRVPVAQVWTALYLLSGAQDVEQHRHGGPTAAKRSIRSFIVINCVLFERVFLSSCVKDDSSCTRGKDTAVV